NAITRDTAAGPQLSADWMWAPTRLAPDLVPRLAAAWIAWLTRLATYTATQPGGLTPSDLPLVALSQHDIDTIEGRYRRALAPREPSEALSCGQPHTSRASGSSGRKTSADLPALHDCFRNACQLLCGWVRPLQSM